jgi:hypothetical protein
MANTIAYYSRKLITCIKGLGVREGVPRRTLEGAGVSRNGSDTGKQFIDAFPR